MALQNIAKPLPWPGINLANTTVVVGASTTLDASGEYECYIGYAREAMAVSHVGFRVAVATGSPTVDVRIETVDAATGLPSGTLWATTTNIVTGALSTGWNLVALTSTANIAKGQAFAVKILYNGGTSVQLNNVGGVIEGQKAVPYRVVNTGTPTKTVLSATPAMALGSSSTTFYRLIGMLPIITVTGGTFNNTNSAKRGLRFQVPFACRVTGLRHYLGTAVGDFNIAILDDSGSELSGSSTAYEGDIGLNTVSGSVDLFFDNPVILQPNTWYRATVEPSSATNSAVMFFTLPSSDYQSGMPGGSNSHYTTFASATWDDTGTDKLPLMDILIDQLDDGVSTTARVIGG